MIANDEIVEIFDETLDEINDEMPVYSGRADLAYMSMTPGLYRAQLGADDECIVRITETESVIVDTDKTSISIDECTNTP